MDGIQPLQRFRFVVLDIDPGDTPDKTIDKSSVAPKGVKRLQRWLKLRHPERVGRTQRPRTGSRIPALFKGSGVGFGGGVGALSVLTLLRVRGSSN